MSDDLLTIWMDDFPAVFRVLRVPTDYLTVL
jgi:hypothetical protein